MPHHHIQSVPAFQTFRQLLSEINRAMLAAGAAERYCQTGEAATLIGVYAGIHQRHYVGQKLMNAFLLIEIINHRRVSAGKSLESLFASGIRYAARIENESAAMPGLVFRYPSAK